jgi:trans-aconitate methyltransferase
VNAPPPAPRWDPHAYEARASFVTRLGEDVLALLDPQPGERILDLGCGTGEHVAAFAAQGCLVEGIDADPAMIARARERYPTLAFRLARGEQFSVDHPLDAVFSNAALHWMTAPEAVARRVFAALRPGGRFVGELGARGNVAHLRAALEHALTEFGIPRSALPQPWYFPTPAEYATLLERVGFAVEVLLAFPRPTPLAGEDGLAAWYRIFAVDYLRLVPPEQQTAVIARAEQLARPRCWIDGCWVADYYRLRFRARRPLTGLSPGTGPSAREAPPAPTAADRPA